MRFPRGGLAAIDENTPHHFRIRLIDTADPEPAQAAIIDRLAAELTVEILSDSASTWLEIRSTFSPRRAAVLRPLHALERMHVGVAGLELLDLVEGPPSRQLERAVAAWQAAGNKGPARRRLEAIAGRETVAVLLTAANDATDRESRAYRFAAGCACFNTSGTEGMMLEAAHAAPDSHPASDLVEAAVVRATLARLGGLPLEIDPDLAVALAQRTDYAGERAVALLGMLTPPLPDGVVSALCSIVGDSGERGERALAALRHADPSTEVRNAIDGALASGDTRAQAAALPTLAALWGSEGARPVWQEFLAGRSAPLRHAAEGALGRHGTPDDLELAAAHLAKIIRARPGAVEWHPPRGAELVALLSRHQDHPAARRSLDDVSARWDRLASSMREWLTKEHPELSPSNRGGVSSAESASPEESLTWPLPEIEAHEDGSHHLWFESTDMFETKDRFVALAMADDRTELLDGDREWVTMRVADPDPASVIEELWIAAGGEAG